MGSPFPAVIVFYYPDSVAAGKCEKSGRMCGHRLRNKKG
jgi:hypothetical protein